MQPNAIHIAALIALRTASANEIARSETDIGDVQAQLHALPADHPDRPRLKAEERALSQQLDEAKRAWRRLSQQ